MATSSRHSRQARRLSRDRVQLPQAHELGDLAPCGAADSSPSGHPVDVGV
jgi:hypothetical protein